MSLRYSRSRRPGINAASMTRGTGWPPAAKVQSASTTLGTVVAIVFDQPLAAVSLPPGSSFGLSGGRTVTLVAIVGNTVLLTVNTPYTILDTIAVSYTPGVNPLLDLLGLQVAAFVNLPVANLI